MISLQLLGGSFTVALFSLSSRAHITRSVEQFPVYSIQKNSCKTASLISIIPGMLKFGIRFRCFGVPGTMFCRNPAYHVGCLVHENRPAHRITWLNVLFRDSLNHAHSANRLVGDNTLSICFIITNFVIVRCSEQPNRSFCLAVLKVEKLLISPSSKKSGHGLNWSSRT